MCHDVFAVKSVPFVYARQLAAGGPSPAQQRLPLIGQIGSVAPWIELMPGGYRYNMLSSILRKDHSHRLSLGQQSSHGWMGGGGGGCYGKEIQG